MIETDLGLGDHDPVISLCKQKLVVFPITDEYTEAFAQKLRGFQKVHGLHPDGIVTDSILDLLGVHDGENN